MPETSPTLGVALSGDAYTAAITSRRDDRRARAAFQDLVTRLAPPGARVLDFGAGTGLDAKEYARRGFEVVGYDIDPNMCAAFARNCADDIAAHRVQTQSGSYRDFVGVASTAERVQVITANFAPLNLIADLPELFAAFYARSLPGALLLASVLNPDFIGDMRYGWWWAKRRMLRTAGWFAIDGAAGSIHRRTPENFAAAAAPYFQLHSAVRGAPVWSRPSVAHRWWLATTRYSFLIFERQ